MSQKLSPVLVSLKKIAEQLERLPHNPGVYKFFDEAGKVIYVGKAKDLRSRVKNYFTKSGQTSIRLQKLVSNIREIDFIEVDSELEALILESNLIKELRPKYNILMKDDKNYVYIKVTLQEDFPRIDLVRKVVKDGAKYFGPKTSAMRAKETLKFLRKIFPYRHCDLEIKWQKEMPENKAKSVKIKRKTINYPCLDYHIKRCVGPCVGEISSIEYQNLIHQIVDFLEGRQSDLRKRLRQEMEQAAKDKNFEQAAKLRDKYLMIEELMEKQRVSDPSAHNQDVIHYCLQDGKVFFSLFMIREGKLIGHENFIFEARDMLENGGGSEILESFLKQYYEKAADIPKEIVLPENVDHEELLKKWLSEMKGEKVRIKVPQKGKKSGLLNLARKNVLSFANRQQPSFVKDKKKLEEALDNLQQALELKKLPKRIECFDISHLAGTEAVGSMVVFKNGQAFKDHYRKFKVKMGQGKPDDLAFMEEVLRRRFGYLSKVASDIPEGYEFRRGLKKDLASIKVILEKEGFGNGKINQREFWLLEKGKELVGVIRVRDLDKDSGDLGRMWINPEYRGNKLGQSLVLAGLRLLKKKKIYLTCLDDLEDYYAALGFRRAIKVPVNIKRMLRESCAETNVCEKERCLTMICRKSGKTDVGLSQKPSLVILDGGKEQLKVGMGVLKRLRLDFPVVALAKKKEEIYRPGRVKVLILPKDSGEFFLFQRIRDEAHRFAIEYNQNLRGKKLTVSELDKVSGVGSQIKKKLLQEFGSVAEIKKASLGDLEKVVGQDLAAKIKEEI